MLGAAVGGYFIASPVIRVLFALLFGLCGSQAVLLRSAAKKPIAPDPKSEQAKQTLLLSSDRFLLSLLLKPLSKTHSVCDLGSVLTANGKTLVPRFRFAPLSADECVSIVSAYQACVILCHTADAAAKSTAERLGAKILEADEVIALLRRLNCLPESAEKPKTPFRLKLKKAINRRRSGALFLCAAMLLAFSRYTAFSVYYLVGAAFCFTLALAALFLKASD